MPFDPTSSPGSSSPFFPDPAADSPAPASSRLAQGLLVLVLVIAGLMFAVLLFQSPAANASPAQQQAAVPESCRVCHTAAGGAVALNAKKVVVAPGSSSEPITVSVSGLGYGTGRTGGSVFLPRGWSTNGGIAIQGRSSARDDRFYSTFDGEPDPRHRQVYSFRISVPPGTAPGDYNVTVWGAGSSPNGLASAAEVLTVSVRDSGSSAAAPRAANQPATSGTPPPGGSPNPANAPAVVPTNSGPPPPTATLAPSSPYLAPPNDIPGPLSGNDQANSLDAVSLSSLASRTRALPDWAVGNASLLAVPWHTQFDDHKSSRANSSVAALGMVLEAYGIKVSNGLLRERANRVQGTGSVLDGISLDTIKQIASEYGLDGLDLLQPGGYRQWKPDDVRSHIRRGEPVIALVKYRKLPGNEGLSNSDADHYIVLVGMTGSGFLYHDPAFVTPDGYARLISEEQLKAAWGSATIPNSALALSSNSSREALKPTERDSVYRFASDQEPVSNAPDSGVLATPTPKPRIVSRSWDAPRVIPAGGALATPTATPPPPTPETEQHRGE